MKVLMFGWEFPPLKNGGLGTACEGLVKGLSRKGVDLTFVLPTASMDITSEHAKILISDRIGDGDVKVTFIDSILTPYMRPSEYERKTQLLSTGSQKNNNHSKNLYGKNLFEEVYRYSEKAAEIAHFDDYDVIHCHDWVTYPAGIKAKKSSNKPLIMHIHATEFDRTGGHPNQVIYNIEKDGFHSSDKIIAVSEYTKSMVVNHYGVDPSKVEVVHNGIDLDNYNTDNEPHSMEIKNNEKLVLFLGRITIQKGPDYFLYAAKKVLDIDPDVKFMIAGTGDMENFIKSKVNELGISDNVIFTGFLQGNQINRAYKMADIYVMPSVSEPFGLTPLESLVNGTPVLISKQSGVSEVLSNCLKVDFWDVDQIANKILGVLSLQELKNELKEKGSFEVKTKGWDHPAELCCNIYNRVCSERI